MDTLIKAICNLAAADMRALSTYAFSTERTDRDRLGAWLNDSMRSRARFIQEFTQGMIELLEMQRRLMTGQIERLSRDTERVAVELAHNTERSMAIATQARQPREDRRVFPLPLPGDRRGRYDSNRRGNGGTVWEQAS